MIYTGDCLEILPTLDAESVQCCVTSPPYYGLRDYGHDGQIGLESTPEAYVDKLVAVFREVRRVLRDDGTLWLNLGDSYFSRTKGSGGSNPETSPKQAWKGSQNGQGFDTRKFSAGETGLKEKDLIGIPWRVAFALQADGWWLRQDIIWNKPNPMPESVTDRCTKAHEYIFLLSKQSRYFYDAEAVKEASQPATLERCKSKWVVNTRNNQDRQDYGRDNQGKEYPFRNRRSVWTITTKPFKMWAETSHLRRVEGDDVSGDMLRKPSPRCPVHAHRDFPCDACAGSRLIHSQHTFPRPVDMRDALLTEISRQSVQSNPLSNMGCSALRYFLSATEHSNGNRKMDHVLLTILPCISSGEIASRIGHRPEALEKIDSAVRIFENSILADSFSDEREIDLLARTLFHSVGKSSSIPPDCLCHYYQKKQSKSSHFATFPPEIPEICIKAGSKMGDTILDPFSGAGTTGNVAERLGRKYIGIELNPTYSEIGEKRIDAARLPLAEQWG